MPGAEIANLKAIWSAGSLRVIDARTGDDVFVIGATTSIPFGSINRQMVNITAAATLAPSTHAGALVYCTTDAVVVTLPAVTVSTVGVTYRVINTASDGGALLQIKSGAATDWINGAGTAAATTNLVISNTKATQQYGDMIALVNSGSTAWYVVDRVGTWAISAAT